MEEPNSVLDGKIQNSHLEDHITGIEHQTNEEITIEYNSTTEVHNGPVKSDNENSTEIGNTANLGDSQSQDEIDSIEVLQVTKPNSILDEHSTADRPDPKLTENPEASKKQKNSYTRADMIDDLAILKTKVEELSNQLAVFQARKMNWNPSVFRNWGWADE